MSRELRRRWDNDMSHPADREMFVEYFPLWTLTSCWKPDGKLDWYVIDHREYEFSAA